MAAQNALTGLIVNTQSQTMSSREIAELTGKEHKHVMRDIRALIDALEQSPSLDFVCKSTTYTGVNGQQYDQYELDKDTCLTLVLGYDAVARMKMIKRWQELEAKLTQNPANLAQPLYILDLRINAANILGVPLHIAQVEAVKEVKVRCGEDFTDLLRLAPAQQNIKQEELMLEPTEVGKRLGLSPANTNKKLAELGLQVKVNGSWAPTVLGKPFCTTHQWTVGNKSGYNLKWNVAEVERMVRIEAQLTSH